MTPLIRRMLGELDHQSKLHEDALGERGLGEHELEGGKLRPETVIYLKPDQIGDDGGPGCRCGKCLFFRAESSECMLTSPAKCDAERGVCGLFLGRAKGAAEGEALELVTKEQAGYVEDGPTMCSTCEYFTGSESSETGECDKIGGAIYRNGCCAMWEAR